MTAATHLPNPYLRELIPGVEKQRQQPRQRHCDAIRSPQWQKPGVDDVVAHNDGKDGDGCHEVGDGEDVARDL
jgi:hypothetical protein